MKLNELLESKAKIKAMEYFLNNSKPIGITELGNKIEIARKDNRFIKDWSEIGILIKKQISKKRFVYSINNELNAIKALKKFNKLLEEMK